MKRKIVLASFVAALACALGCEPRTSGPGGKTGPAGAGPALPDDPKRIERLLPEDTLAFFTFDDIALAKEDLPKTALGAIWREEEVQAFFAKPLAQIDRIASDVERQQDFAFADFGKAFGGQVAAALVDVSVKGRMDATAAAVVAARVTDAEAAGRVFDFWMRAQGKYECRDVEVPGWRGIVVSVPVNEDITLAMCDDLLVFGVCRTGADQIEKIMSANSAPPEKSLATSEEFRKVASRLGAERIATLYASVGGLHDTMMDLARAQSADDTEKVGKVLDALGLTGVRAAGCSWAVDAPGILQRTYVHAPAPRKGLMALAEGKPLGSGTLALAPEGALSYSAASLRLTGIMEVARAVAKAVDGSDDLEEFLREARENLGFDVERDLLRNLGDEVVVTVMPPEVSGANPLMAGAGGISVVLSMKDPAAVGGVVDTVLATVDGLLRGEGMGSVEEIEYLGTRIRYARIMGGMIAPSVALAGDRLIITGGLASAKELVKLVTKPGEPFVESEEFRAALARVGGEVGMTLSYSDTRQTAATALGFAGLAGPLLAQGQGRRPPPGRRARCTSHLKQIGYACQLWSSDYNEGFPESLGVLFPEYVTEKELFSCPDSGMGYVYVSGLTAADDGDWILAYDHPESHGGEGVNVLHIAGMVEWETDVAAVERRVEEQLAQAKAKGRAAKVILPAATPGPRTAGPPEIDFGEPTDWVDLALLPSPRSLTRHLFPMVSTTTVDDEGFLSAAYGPAGGVGLPSLTGTSSVAIIAAIAIPNLLSSRMASNESCAIACCRVYLAAQSTFRRVDWYGKNELVYANPRDGSGFPDLYQIGGLDSDNEPIQLIDLVMASATGPDTPKAGYYFVDLTGDDVAGGDYDYSVDCGLCAVPAVYGKTGLSTFVIDLTGTVYMKDTGGRPLTRYPDTVTDLWIPVSD